MSRPGLEYECVGCKTEFWTIIGSDVRDLSGCIVTCPYCGAQNDADYGTLVTVNAEEVAIER